MPRLSFGTIAIRITFVTLAANVVGAVLTFFYFQILAPSPTGRSLFSRAVPVEWFLFLGMLLALLVTAACSIAALLGGRQEKIEPVGMNFRESEKNTTLWKRWFRFLLIDQWAVFFVGAIFGMILPATLVGYLAKLPGAGTASAANMPVYAAFEIQRIGGGVFFYVALLTGFLILFSTQMVVFEMLVRNLTDGLYAASARFRNLIHGNPQRFYYPFMVALLIVMSIIIFQALPTELITWSANMSNFASLFFPLVLIYLNSKLPKPAQAPWWSTVILILNVLFFGFFFANFLSNLLYKVPIVRF